MAKVSVRVPKKAPIKVPQNKAKQKKGMRKGYAGSLDKANNLDDNIPNYGKPKIRYA
jgi:hypothetical protein